MPAKPLDTIASACSPIDMKAGRNKHLILQQLGRKAPVQLTLRIRLCRILLFSFKQKVMDIESFDAERMLIFVTMPLRWTLS